MKNDTYEQLLYDDILVDCYGEAEQAACWHAYAVDTMRFPFKAKLVLPDERRGPTKVKVKVLGLTDAPNVLRPLQVEVLHEGLIWAMDLAELKQVKADAETAEVEGVYGDWVGGE